MYISEHILILIIVKILPRNDYVIFHADQSCGLLNTANSVPLIILTAICLILLAVIILLIVVNKRISAGYNQLNTKLQHIQLDNIIPTTPKEIQYTESRASITRIGSEHLSEQAAV